MKMYDPIYAANHRRIRRNLGKASEYTCTDCGGSALDWSQTHGTSGESDDDFEPRCRSCHVIYDGLIERNKATHWGRANKGKKRDEATRRRMSEAHIGMRHTSEALEKKRRNWKNQYGQADTLMEDS